MNWTNDKPVFTEDCVLVCAWEWAYGWDYKLYTIKLKDGYWKLLDSGIEYGKIEELQADKYLILPKHE